MSDSLLEQFLNREDSELIQSIAEDISSHLSEINKPLRGYAIMTGQDAWVSDLIVAFDTVDRKLPFLERLLGERFDVPSWQMSSRTLQRTQDVLEKLNQEFRSFYPVRKSGNETDETEERHVDKLHQSIIAGFALAKKRLPELKRGSVFKVFCIPDSDLDIDLRSSKEFNSWLIHTMYRIWR